MTDSCIDGDVWLKPQTTVLLAEGAMVLRRFATPVVVALMEGVEAVVAQSPLRRLIVPNGRPMRIEMTNCGLVGWVNIDGRYRYSRVDPLTGRSWPGMPATFRRIAGAAASAAGYPDFQPAVCIINRYAVGADLQMHQDRDDTQDRQPVVSVSLGLPAIFHFGGQGRGEKPLTIPLDDGDVVVWGGASRMHRHGVAPVAPGVHPRTGAYRYNLTFRTAKIPRR